MKENKTRTLVVFLFILFVAQIYAPKDIQGQTIRDTTYLRISFHIFDNDSINGNFHPDSTSHRSFLKAVVDWINYQMVNLDPLKPEVSSTYVETIGIQIRTDSFYYHIDNYAWDCSEGIDSDYMRQVYVDEDSSLNYRQKYRTLPIFLGNNYSIIGGHNSLIGDKWFIAMRGLFSEYLNRPYQDAVRDCGRGILHELGHSLGLSHNFSGGDNGEQCDDCEDNGCPQEGTSNNIMDYWPAYGYALSECQKNIVWEHLNGYRGNIAEVIWNDSCYRDNSQIIIKDGERVSISDTTYYHSDVIIKNGGSLIVNSYLSVPEDCSIVVENGANLRVENGTIGNLCGDIWKGVRVFGSDSELGGKISFINARLENGETAITIMDNADLEIDQTDFVNNLSSLKILSWTGEETIRNCRFETIGRLNHWEEWSVPQGFVFLEDSEQIFFKNCIFYNSEGHRTYSDLYSGIGIIAENSSLNINSCSFENLFKAVVVGADSSGNSLEVDVCSFAYIHCGVQLDGLAHAKISSSSFNLNRLNTLPVYGVFSKRANLVELVQNNFYSDYGGDNLTGIVSDFEFPGTHFIHDNIFSLINEGIVTLNSDYNPLWPEVLTELDYQNLVESPLGSVWFSNQFDKVRKQIINLDSDGGGILKSNEGEYDLFNVDWSREFIGAGFGVHSKERDLCIVKPYPDYSLKKPTGILFHVLSDDSWIPGDSNEFEPGYSWDIYTKLKNEYSTGLQYLENSFTPTHQEWVFLAEHLKKYPWIVYTSKFELFLEGDNISLPNWFWEEISKALEEGSWWKNQLNQFIVSLAKNQTIDFDKYKNVIGGSDSDFEFQIFDPVAVNFSADIGRMNPGLVKSSSVPDFIVVPNPARVQIGIRFNNAFPELTNSRGLEWFVRDIFGRTISQGFINSIEDQLIKINNIPGGSYFIEIWNQNQFLGIHKFIILPN